MLRTVEPTGSFLTGGVARPVDRIATRIEDALEPLASAAVDRLYREHPRCQERYGPTGRARCVEDAGFHLRYLAAALSSEAPALFVLYARWATTLLLRYHVQLDDIVGSFSALAAELEARLPDGDGTTAAGYVRFALDQLTQAAEEAPPPPLTPLATRYLDVLLAGNRSEACRLVLDALDDGLPVKDVYLTVFEPVLVEVGRRWHARQLSAAQEHFCTATTQMAMSLMFPTLFNRPHVAPRKVVVACVSGEQHEVGARMVSDFFEMAGWQAYYLGANTPTADVILYLRQVQADVLAISVTLTPHLGRVADVIRTARADETLAHVPILVGGYPFKQVPGLWQRMGADGYAADAASAVDMAAGLLEDRRRTA